MAQTFPVEFDLKDGTHVLVNKIVDSVFEFHLTRLNSEKLSFNWLSETDETEDSNERRFDKYEKEAIAMFKEVQRRR
jgi:hypothetical protein